MIGAESFIEVDSCQRAKQGQFISGDVFLSRKIEPHGRMISVLSDGLGSGVKASVLATMTATMALKFTASAMDIHTSAEIIMDTLPICSVRKISYSTFTVVDMASTGETRCSDCSAAESGSPAQRPANTDSTTGPTMANTRKTCNSGRAAGGSCFLSP